MNPKLKEILDKYPDIWKTESSFLSWIRGGIRGGLWNKHPVKLEFIKKNRIQIPNPNPKGKKATVWGAVCALTGDVVPISDIQVDHKVGNNSLKSLEDIQSFIEAMVIVTDDDLQLVSKQAHAIKTHAERKGCSFEDAIIDKKVIEFSKKSTNEQKSILTEILDERIITSLKNASDRKRAYHEWLKEEK